MSFLSLTVLSIVGFATILVTSANNYQQIQPQEPYRHPQLPLQQPQGHLQPIVHHPNPPYAGSGPPSAFTGNQPIVNRPYPDGQAPPMNSILLNEIGDGCDEDGNPLPPATAGPINPLDVTPSTLSNTTDSNVTTSTTTDGSSTTTDGSSTTTGSSSTTDGSSSTIFHAATSSEASTTTGLPTLPTLLPTLPTLLPTITTGAPLTLPTLVPTAPSTTTANGLRKRRATDEQKMKMGKVMKLVEMVKLQDCVARVICALNCAPDAYGADGKKVFSMMLQVQTSGTVNETETKYYITAAMNGRRNREAKNCGKCNETYCNCEATSQDLIDVVSLVQLDN